MHDPMDELIDDLEQVLPPERTTAWGQMPPLAEMQYWAGRVLDEGKPLWMDATGEIRGSDTGKPPVRDDPGFQAHLRRLEAWHRRAALEAEETSRRSRRNDTGGSHAQATPDPGRVFTSAGLSSTPPIEPTDGAWRSRRGE